MKRVRSGWPISTKYWRAGDQRVGQRLGHFGGEEAGVGVGQTVDLRVHRGQHLGMGVSEARHGRAASGIDVGPALGVEDLDAPRAHRQRRQMRTLAVQDMRGVGLGQAGLQSGGASGGGFSGVQERGRQKSSPALAPPEGPGKAQRAARAPCPGKRCNTAWAFSRGQPGGPRRFVVPGARHAPRARLARRRDSPRRGAGFLPPTLLGARTAGIPRGWV